jgi:hypothetical protein
MCESLLFLRHAQPRQGAHAFSLQSASVAAVVITDVLSHIKACLFLSCHAQPGEVLTRALKRISGSNAQQTKAMGKRERLRLQQQQQEQQAAQDQTKKPKWQQGRE